MNPYKPQDTPPLKVLLNDYKKLYLKYFNQCHVMSSELHDSKLKQVMLKAEIARLKIELEKNRIPYLGEID